MNKNRYDRQIRVGKIGNLGQEKLNSSHVLIVGSGALGTYAAEQLVRGGVGQLTLVDPDVVEESNLQRQTLFTTADALTTQPKVLAAQKALLTINPEVVVHAVQASFEALIFEQLPAFDLVLDCTDNFLVRQAINDFCLHYDLPFVFASAAGTNGQVMAISPRLHPCLNCVFPDLLNLEKNCETIGVVTPLIPMISSLQVSLAYQILLDAESVSWETMHLVGVWSLTVTKFSVSKQAHCPACASQHSANSVSVDRVCGGVYQAIFADFDTDKFRIFCQQHAWTFKENELALRIWLTEREITVFKTGRLLFYHFDENSAYAIVKELEHVF